MRSFFSEIFETSFYYEANVHLVYFSSYSKTVCFIEILVRSFYVSKYMVIIHTYTSNFPLKRGKLSENNYLIRFWKEKCTNIFVFVFRKRGRRISTFNQNCSSILWCGNEGRLYFQLTLITKKITGLKLMA